MIKITSVDESIGSNGLKVLVHGQAGAGKTVLSATTGCETLIISAEAGLLSIQGAPSYIKTTVVNSVADVNEVHRFLTTQKHKFKWVILDSITEIAETCLATELKADPDPRKSYPAFQGEMTTIIKKFRDLSGMHVMMTCKQVRSQDADTGITRYSPLMPGNKLGPAIPYLFDLVMALRVEKDSDGKLVRILQTYQDLKYEAKDRSGVLEQFEEPNLENILNKVYQKLELVKHEDLIANEDLYFYDEVESEVIIIKKGEKYNPEIDDYCTRMTEKEYHEYQGDEPKVHEPDDSDTDSKKRVYDEDTYYYSTRNNDVHIVLAGQDCSKSLEECSTMTKSEYDEFIAEKLKAEAAKKLEDENKSKQ